MMLEAIIFDWDGVLNNSAHTFYKAYLSVLEKLGLPTLTFSDFHKLWESDYRRFEEKIGITRDKRKVSDKIWLDSYMKLKEETRLFPEARDFLLKIKKDYRVALVTVGSLKRITIEIDRYGLEGIFDVIVTGDDTEKLKPDPEGLNVCTEKLNVNPKNCVYVGDSRGDILAAKNAGMISIFVTWGYHDLSILKDTKPSYMVNNFNELYESLRALK